jgi:hypothetical protein
MKLGNSQTCERCGFYGGKDDDDDDDDNDLLGFSAVYTRRVK